MRQIASPVGRRHAEQLISNQKLVTNESRPAENSDSTVMQHRPTPSRRQSLNGRAPTRVEQQARGASPAQTGLTKWHWFKYTYGRYNIPDDLGGGYAGLAFAGAGDFNADGQPDILARHDGDGHLFKYLYGRFNAPDDLGAGY